MVIYRLQQFFKGAQVDSRALFRSKMIDIVCQWAEVFGAGGLGLGGFGQKGARKCMS